MGNFEEKLASSKDALNKSEKLINLYTAESVNVKHPREKNKITDEFVLALNGLTMLMTELDRTQVVEMLDSKGLVDVTMKSIRRIKRGKSLAFT